MSGLRYPLCDVGEEPGYVPPCFLAFLSGQSKNNAPGLTMSAIKETDDGGHWALVFKGLSLN